MTKARTLGNFVSTGNPLSDGTIAASEVTGLATVATSGSYNDLSNKPTITTTATNIAGGSNGTIPYQSAADTTQMLAAGTSGYFLKSNGVAAPSWDAVPATTPAGSSGQLQYNNAGAFAAVSSGTSGQVLTSAGSGVVPTWATVSAGFTLSTPVTLSGPAVTFSGIPAGVKQVVVTFANVNFLTGDTLLIRLGYSGPTYPNTHVGIARVFYNSNSGGYTQYSASYFQMIADYGSANMNGQFIFNLLDNTNHVWVGSGMSNNPGTNNYSCYTAGRVNLGNALESIKIMTFGNSGNNFDGGTVNIAYI